MDLITLPGELISFNPTKKIISSKSACKQLVEKHYLIKVPIKAQEVNENTILEEDAEEARSIVRLTYLGELYVPREGDAVIGVVERRFGGESLRERQVTEDKYELRINAQRKGHLGTLEFEGATKRSRPNIKVNGLIYCRIKRIPQLLQYQLTCISAKNKKEWTTGEALYRELKGKSCLNLSSN